MGKVIRLHDKQDSKQEELVEFLEMITDQARHGEITSVQLSANHIDGDICTGYFNLNLIQKMVMLQHLNLDIQYEMTKANIEDLVEHL